MTRRADVWLQDGQRSRCVQDALLLAGLPATGSGSASRRLSSRVSEIALNPLPANWSRLSAASRQQKPADRRRETEAAHWSLLRAFAIALCLMTLPACSLLQPKLPAVTPAAIKPEPLQCLDRAMQQCPGVADMTPTTCADAVVLAVDAMTGLAACQDIHAELARCVREYQERAR